MTEEEMLALEKESENKLKTMNIWGECYEKAILSGRPVLGTEKIQGVTYLMEKRLIGKADCDRFKLKGE